MKPEDIRRLYAREAAATEAEAAATQAEIRSDPALARAHIKTIYALSTEDRDFAFLLKLFLEGMVMELIEERAEADDAFALKAAGLILDLMEKLKPPPRGKPTKTKMA